MLMLAVIAFREILLLFVRLPIQLFIELVYLACVCLLLCGRNMNLTISYNLSEE